MFLLKPPPFLVPVCLLLLAAVCVSWQNTDWHTHTSFEGRFSVLVPGDMVRHLKTVETEMGAIDYHSLLYQCTDRDADNVVYMVSFCDYPEDSIHSDSLALLKDFFDATIESAVESVQGSLRYSSDIQLKDYPGRIWRIDYNQGQAIIKTKAYLAGRRFYSVQAITVKEKSLNTAADKFLDSFRLIE